MIPDWLIKWAIAPNLVVEIATGHGLNPKLIMAMVQQESAGGRHLTRYQPNYRYLYRPADYFQLLGISHMTEITHQSTSWGPLHVMGATARELGYDDELPHLIFPGEGLEYGCRYFRQKVRETESIEDAVAAYNGGIGAVRQRERTGTYPQDVETHVDKVMAYYRELTATD